MLPDAAASFHRRVVCLQFHLAQRPRLVHCSSGRARQGTRSAPRLARLSERCWRGGAGERQCRGAAQRPRKRGPWPGSGSRSETRTVSRAPSCPWASRRRRTSSTSASSPRPRPPTSSRASPAAARPAKTRPKSPAPRMRRKPPASCSSCADVSVGTAALKSAKLLLFEEASVEFSLPSGNKSVAPVPGWASAWDASADDAERASCQEQARAKAASKVCWARSSRSSAKSSSSRRRRFAHTAASSLDDRRLCSSEARASARDLRNSAAVCVSSWRRDLSSEHSERSTSRGDSRRCPDDDEPREPGRLPPEALRCCCCCGG
mmetsp:Transcript_56291/g.182787  ORF Transcript_56291/g.182787 Transcript_56291/m.182787 type:complete len:320 (-) Transcript_56291:709-1668(-)